MTRAAVLYASQMGHTEKIAETIARGLDARGMPTTLLTAGEVPEDFGGFGACVVVGSVHSGEHAEELAAVVGRHLDSLRSMYSALCSVSLEAAVVENAHTEDARAEAEIELHKPISRFLEDTGWTPNLVEPVAGVLPYAHVGPFRRLALEHIAFETGLPTDTSRDHVFTNWEALDRFIDVFARKASVMDAIDVSPMS